MRKILAALCMVLLLSVFAYAQDSKEVLTLKRDLAQERVVRIKTELELMKVQYREGQEALKATSAELEKLNQALKAMDVDVKEKQ